MIREEHLQQMHDKLKQEQERLEPHLTLERMRELLDYSSVGAVRHIMQKMVSKGLAEKVDFGGQVRYRLL